MLDPKMNSLLVVSCFAGLTWGCGAATTTATSPPVVQSTGVKVSSVIATVLGQPDRGADDRALDVPRQAAETLAYLDVSPGMNVAVLAPGAGYFMELLARSVGLDGRLFARNPPSLLGASRLERAWDERLSRPAGARVIRVDDELVKPLAVQWLDLVFLEHDYAALHRHAVDTAAIDAVAWNALHPGGRFVVVEREIESAKTRDEIERIGFRFTSEALFLRQGVSPSDWSDEDGNANANANGDPSAKDKRVLLTFTKP
jgi:predicted methyltransferase